MPDCSEDDIARLKKVFDEHVDCTRYYDKMRVVCPSSGAILQKPALADIASIAYLWSAKPTGEQVTLSDYETLTVDSLHTFAYHGFFKPSLDEVLRFIPTNILEEARDILLNTQPNCQYNAAALTPCCQFHMGITTVWYRK